MLEKRKIYKALFWREVLTLKYNFSEVIISALACFLIFSIFLLVLDTIVLSEISIFYGLILSVTIMTIGLIDCVALEEDLKSGFLEQLLLLPIEPFKVILIKFIVGLVKYLMINSLIWFAVCCLVEQEFWLFYIQYVLFCIYLASASLMISSINLSIQSKKNSFSIILIIPLIFPQVILSILSVDEYTYTYLFLSLTVVMAPIFILFSSLIIINTISDN